MTQQPTGKQEKPSFWTKIERVRTILQVIATLIVIAPTIFAALRLIQRGLTAVVPAWLILLPAAIAATLGYLLWRKRGVPQKRQAPQELLIHIALFGKGTDRITDVTQAVRALVEAGQRKFKVGTDLLPSLASDRAPGEEKDLKVIYSYGGETHTAMAHEYSWLELPGSGVTSTPTKTGTTLMSD